MRSPPALLAAILAASAAAAFGDRPAAAAPAATVTAAPLGRTVPRSTRLCGGEGMIYTLDGIGTRDRRRRGLGGAPGAAVIGDVVLGH